MIQIDPRVQATLNRFQKHGKTYVYGGFLRDIYLNVTPHDVDLSTELSLPEIKKFMGSLTWTEKGFEVGVGRFSSHGMNFEISHYAECIKTKLAQSDYTINSLFFDGNEIHDLFGGGEDIQRKVIRSLANPSVHFQTNPQAFVRALRLAAQTGFSLDEQLVTFLKNNLHYFMEAGVNRIQNEGYRILLSAYPLMTFHYLQEVGLLSKQNDFDPYEEIPLSFDNIYVRLAFIATKVGIGIVDEFLTTFHLSKKLQERVDNLFSYMTTDREVKNPYIFNELIVLKRLEYRKEPEKLREYLLNLRKK